MIEDSLGLFYDASLGIIGVDEKLPYGTTCGVVSTSELKGDPTLYGYGVEDFCWRMFFVDVLTIPYK